MKTQLGNLKNTIGSLTRVYKNCNKNNSNTLNYVLNINNVSLDNDNALNCVLNVNNISSDENTLFNSYHILNDTIFDNIIEDNIVNKNNSKGIISGPYSPTQIKKAYDINNILPLKGIRPTIITIISAFSNPYLINDVKKFGQLFGLPPCNLQIYNFSRYFYSGWAVETTLDVQWAYAINPYAQIRVILAASSRLIDIFNAIKYANNKNNFKPAIDTDIISMSLGTLDSGVLTSYNNLFSNKNTIYLAASGDSNNVSFPSSCTNVISVGGTTLSLNNDNTRSSEKVWNLSGSGFSKYFVKPYYQPNLFNNNYRITPDLCCVADPNTPCYIVLNGKTYSIGGTSLSCPIYAGILSILTQKLLNEKKQTYTSVQNNTNTIQPKLYNLINSFYDVTQGNSGTNQAKPEFDSASGLGVINLNQIIQYF